MVTNDEAILCLRHQFLRFIELQQEGSLLSVTDETVSFGPGVTTETRYGLAKLSVHDRQCVRNVVTLLVESLGTKRMFGSSEEELQLGRLVQFLQDKAEFVAEIIFPEDGRVD